MEFAVIGLGRFGLALASELQNLGHTVIGVDSSKENCNKASVELENVYQLDATNSNALKEVGIDQVDRVIVGIGANGMTASFLACLTLQELGVENIIAKASTVEQRKILSKMGIEHIIMPESDMGYKVAQKLSKNFLFDYFEFSSQVRADRIVVTQEMTTFVNKDIQTINLRKKYNINIIGIQRGEQIIVPESTTEVLVGDTILIFGATKQLEAFENQCFKQK